MLAGDGSYDAPGAAQVIVAAPATAVAPNLHAERYIGGAAQGAWASSAYQVAWFADGYAVEAFIVAADLDLASWPASGSLGFDLVLDVAGPAGSPDLRCGLQLGQTFLHLFTGTSACNGEPWCNTRAFCLPALQ